MKNHHSHSEFYSFEKIQQYINGELSDQEMHAMQKQMLNDPFLQDAVEGWEQVEKSSRRVALIQEITQQLPAQPPVSQFTIWKTLTAIAATISLVLVISYLLNQSPELDTAQAFEESPLPTKNAYKEEEQSDPKPSSTRKQNAPTPTVDAEKISSAEVKEKSKVTPEKTVVPAVAKPVLEEVEEKINMEIADQDLEASELIASDIALAKDVATTPKINARASRITTDTTMAISNNQSKQAKEKASEMKMALVEEQNDEAPFEPTLNPLNAQKRKKPYAANPYQLYNLEQYKEAAPLLEDFLRKSPSDQVLLYLLSVSYLKINQEEKAIEKLSSLKKKVFKGFKPNEVITLIKEGKAEEALQQLQQYTLVNKELILRE